MLRVYRLRNRRRGHSNDPEPDRNRWLVSYADFITLLFAFFTTLFAISTVDARKLADIVAALQVAFDTSALPHAASSQASGRPTVPSVRPSIPVQVPAPAAKVDAQRPNGLPEAALDQVQKRLAQRLASAIKTGQVAIEIDHRGLVIPIREAGSFGVGRADLPGNPRDVAEIATPPARRIEITRPR